MTTALASHGVTSLLVGNVQHWEETGARLESAITAYLHSCLALEQATLTAPPVGIDHLPARLNRRIEYFHTLMTQPLAQSLASVVRTRNKLVTPIYRMPSEILERIFDLAVKSGGEDLPMKQATSASCLCLYRIVSVCSVWRKVGLSHPRLWTLVPLVYLDGSQTITKKCAKYSLERAGQLGLQVVADLLDVHYDQFMRLPFTTYFTENGPRFRTVNLRSSSRTMLEYALDSILRTAVPGSTSDLSLCYDPSIVRQPQPSTTSSIRFNVPSEQAAFESILSSLQVLRLNNILVQTGNSTFSRLIELRIQEVSFETEVDLGEFLRGLASAPQLQTLDIISVDANELSVSPLNYPCSIPSLKTLFLDNLSSNVIHTVLSSIKLGTHRTVLSVSNEIYVAQRPEGRVHTGIPALKNTLQSYNIDTLVVGEAWFPFNRGDALRSLISALPSLTTIYFDEQHLDHTSLAALTRRSDTPESQMNVPKLRRIYIACSGIDDISDQTAFKDMLSSHPLEELVLGARLSEVVDITEPGNVSNGDLDYVEITGPDVRTISIRTWLHENIPKLRLIEGGERFRYKSSEWQLW